MSEHQKHLDLGDIQGNIVRGYRLSHVAHLFGTITFGTAREWQAALHALLPHVTFEGCAYKPDVAVNIGFSHAGLKLLVPSISDALSTFDAFASGMPARASRWGDHEGATADWDARHVWISIYGNDRTRLASAIARVRSIVRQPLADEAPWGEAIVNDGWRIEHFGFRDDISQPAIEGAPNMERLLAGGGKLNASGQGWSPIAAGEFVLGYPNERGVDVLARMPPRAAQILRNGTFAAFQRIEQHVDLFEQTLSREAARWNMCPSDLMNKMVGRKPNGESLTRPGEVTDFSYADDPDGTRCPLGAHVRRANPRLSGEHRVIRRGMPYGQKLDSGDRGGSASSDARGIYFVAFNASIEDQFEFIQSTWLNKPVGVLPQSRDPLSSGGSDAGRMLIEGDAEAGRDPIVLELPKFVTCRGGQYYFLPGIRALRRIADLPDAQAQHRPILTLEQQ